MPVSVPLQLQTYLLPGKAISLFEPDKEVIFSSYRSGEIPFPYWSQVWPAAIGLAQFLANNERYTANKKVLELAAGLGLPSLVAAANAATVVASDYVPEAVVAMQQTITYHQLQNMQAKLLDWTNLPADLEATVLLLSDVSYDEPLFALQKKVIRRFLRSGTTVIISTPQRLVAKQAIEPLLSFCIHQEELVITHQQRMVAVSLFILQQ